GDVEEVDIIPGATEAGLGGVYGWPRCEGNLPSGCPHTGEIAPVFTYTHASQGGDGAIVGGGFAGGLFGPYSGYYFYADYESGEIHRLKPNASRNGVTGTASLVATEGDGPVDLVF